MQHIAFLVPVFLHRKVLGLFSDLPAAGWVFNLQ